MGIAPIVRNRLLHIVSKHPYLGPGLWIFSIQYFIVQLVVASAWTIPYSWANNYISDLGNTGCGLYAGLYVCSPYAWLMNASFVVFGLSMVIGAALIYCQFVRSKLSLLGFGLMIVSGIGTILVGLFPENSLGSMHTLGAFLGLGVGNVSVIVLGLALKSVNKSFKVYTVVSGLVSLAAFGLFIGDNYLGIGRGGVERLVSYPFTIWMISFGFYMTIVRIRGRFTTL